MNHPAIHQFYAGMAPWAGLSLLLIGRNPHPGLRRKIAALPLAALALLVIPINGWNVAAWIRVLEPNPSLILTGLLLVALASRLTGKRLFRRTDWKACWFFEAIAALLLYPLGLGLTRIDSYGWGWMTLLPLVCAITATLLLLRGNRFGMMLLLPFLGWILGFQESRNFWDALVDPFIGTVSIVMSAFLAIRPCSPLTSPARVID